MAETVERLKIESGHLPIGWIRMGGVLVTVYESIREPGRVIVDVDQEDAEDNTDVRVYVNDGIIHDG